MDLGIGVGRGYVSADRHPAGTVPAGAIPVDAAFSPIQRVSYSVENARLGKVTDYEKLILEIWTNGAVSPEEALSRAARHLKAHFAHLAPEGREEEDEEVEASGEAFLQESLAKPLEDLPLPAREKSIDEIKTALAALGLSLGMRIDPNLLGALGRGGTK
jgi:DNA-directed RNA polymerase subunit alpha